MMGKCTVLIFILHIILCSAEFEFNYTFVGTRENVITVKHLNFSQWLDHKNPEDDRKFMQRYAVTATFYKKSGPAFLYVHGSDAIRRKRGFPNHILAYAQNLNAICFSLEHRFYGGSWPVNGSRENHLSSAQAVSDIGYFITVVTKEFHLPKDTKWITFGCSYGGTLAVRSRLVHPRIHGSVVSSAPIFAKVDYFEYDQIIEESLRSYHSNCVESIKLAFEEISYLVDSTEIRKKMSKLFYSLHSDESRTNDDMKNSILHNMLKIIGDLVQYNDSHHIPIPLLCRIMNGHNGTKLDALAEIKKMYMGFEYDEDISTKKNQNRNSEMDEDDTISWRYQRCSEFGYFSSYTNVTFLSGVKHLLSPIEQVIEIHCKPLFGPNFSIENVTEKINQTNSRYGKLYLNVSNTIYINGGLDPWFKASVYEKADASLYDTIFIEGTTHCTDVYPPRDTDVPELTNARLQVFKIINSWLNQISTSNNSGN